MANRIELAVGAASIRIRRSVSALGKVGGPGPRSHPKGVHTHPSITRNMLMLCMNTKITRNTCKRR
jgi:hypothetical protein